MSFALIRRLFRRAIWGGFPIRAGLGLIAGVLVGFAPGETQNAVANGDTRTIQLYHAHTHESISATYMVDGSYDQGVLDKLNWFLRDWRRDEPTKMDPRLFDTIWEVYREAGSRQPIEVMSAYRSPETNAMLRRRTRGVAEHSQHILGKAMDQHYMDVPMSRIREIAMRLQRGGVGFYPTAGTPFVHMDVGGVRHWPRMSYDQLARLFPDGKTVHIPSNGQPLPGYEMARAELEARGDGSYPTATQLKSKGFFAWLFGSSDEDEDSSEGGARVASSSRTERPAASDRSVGTAVAYNSSGKDGGMRSFLANQGPQPAPETAYGRVAREATPMAVTQPTPVQADQALATAMTSHQPEPAREPDAAPQPTSPPPAPQAVPELPVPTSTLAGNGLIVPVPPTRPTELAGVVDLPLPPSRPAEFNRPIEGPAPTPVRTARGDAIGSILTRRSGPALPDVIMRGSTGSAPQLLAYAGGPESVQQSRSASGTVPLPVVRPPDLVGARLDRGNFRSLTASTKTDHAPSGSPLGAALGARAASRAIAGANTSSGVLSSFGPHPSPLDPDRFSGPTVKGSEHLVTSRRADAGQGRSTAE